MESDTSDKKIPLEEMPKDDIIKKYNNLLVIAKKAKQSKNGFSKPKFENNIPSKTSQMANKDALEELKIAKERESKLTNEIDALNEMFESFSEKQRQFAELENQARKSNDKISELSALLQKSENNLELKISECNHLKETLLKQGGKYSDLKEKYADILEKLDDFKESYAKIDIEKKIFQEKLLKYEKAENEKANLHIQHEKEIKQIKELEERILDKEKHIEEWTNRCLKVEEEYKTVPENWKTLAEENEKLGRLLRDAEDARNKLQEELTFFRNSLPEFKEKSRDCAKLSEDLLKEERENLKLMEEINDLKKFKSVCGELEAKLKNFEREKENLEVLLKECEGRRIDDVKTLGSKHEREKEILLTEKAEKEASLNSQLSNLESQIKKLQKKLDKSHAEKQNLEKLLEIEKGKTEKILSKMDSFEMSKKEELENHEEIKRRLEERVKQLEISSDHLKSRLDEVQSEKCELKNRLDETEFRGTEEAEKLRTSLKNLERKMIESEEKWETEMEEKNKKLRTITAENDAIKKNLEMEKENVRKLKKQLENLEVVERENVNLKEKLNELSTINVNLTESVKCNLREKEMETANESRAKIEEELKMRNEENESLKKEMENIKRNHREAVTLVRSKLEELLSSFAKMKELRNNFDKELKNKLKAFQLEQLETRENIENVVLKYVGQLHKGNSELLSEMNDMNQVLKERGETISKLEQLNENQRKELEEASTKITNQSCKLAEKNKKLEEMEEEVSKAKLEVENKHRALRDLEEEIWKLKNSDGQGEALSSSTLSRADEAARLMELEESFEERYSKLKVVAVKLKKKVTDLQKQVETERNNLLTTEKEYQAKISEFHNQIKSLRNIQTECDRLQDVMDEEKKEKNALRKTLESTQGELTSCKQQLEEVKIEKEKFAIDRNSFEKIKKELTAHIGELKQTVEKQKKEFHQAEKKIEEMKNQLSTKDRHIEEEREKHKAAILLLEEQKLDSKKHSVLELEMAAYEKTAEDLKKRLDSKEKERKDLEIQLETERKSSAAKDEEISEFKARMSDNEAKASAYKNQLRLLNEDADLQRGEIKKKSDLIKSLEKSLEEKNSRIENLTVEIEGITKEKFKKEEKFRIGEEKLCRQIHNLEEKVSSLEDSLGRQGIELDELKKEYHAYKVRAQSVLRQSQKEVNPSKQQNALEELEQLRSASDSLKIRLEETSKKMHKLSEENCSHQEEKKRLIGRMQELNSALGELREENHKLKEEKQRENEQHAEALRMQKLQSETLAQCLQREAEDAERKYEIQLEELKRELEEANNAAQRRGGQVFFKPDVRRGELVEKRKILGGFVPVKPEKDVLDVMLLEREECEGSESVDSISPQTGNNSGLIPLEQLLSQSDVPDAKKSLQDAAQLQVKLDKSENRIKHLSILLAEAESDSARLTQLNEVLKEEIKRLERSLEREKHAENFEYLKNVIIKFVSLSAGDEKLRLVPVLNTILKLSPEEENTLTNSAKGIQQTGNRTWGLNLGLWTPG